MGFNLAMFFEELEAIIEGDENISIKLADLVRAIEEGKRYAEECNQL